MIGMLHGSINEESAHIAQQAQHQDLVSSETLGQGARKVKHGSPRKRTNETRNAHLLARPAHFTYPHVGEVLDAPRGKTNNKDEEEKEDEVRSWA